MNAENLTAKEKVGVILVKGGCCTGSSDSIVEKSKSLLTEISTELGTDIIIKEITTAAAINGPFSQEVKVKGWEAFNRSGSASLPMIVINGELISTGMPDRSVIKKALQTANKIQTVIQ